MIITEKNFRAFVWGRNKYLFYHTWYPSGAVVGHCDPGGEWLYYLPRKCRKRQYLKIRRYDKKSWDNAWKRKKIY